MNKNDFVTKSILKKNNPNIFKNNQNINSELQTITNNQPIIIDQDVIDYQIPTIDKIPDNDQDIIDQDVIDYQIPNIDIPIIIEKTSINNVIIKPIIIVNPDEFLELEKFNQSYHDFIISNPNYIYNQLMYNRLLSKKKFQKHYKY
jgi:hypothetical protein